MYHNINKKTTIYLYLINRLLLLYVSFCLKEALSYINHVTNDVNDFTI